VTQQPSVVRMVDDIARNLPHLPEAERAQVIAAHIRSFWDPRMRAQLAQLVGDDPSAYSPVIVAAVAALTAA
jgi:formate dehydrogenase subunit delta